MAAHEEPLRRRKVGSADPAPGPPPPAPSREPAGRPDRLQAGSFWLTRVVLLRALAFVYCVAFLVAFQQNKALIGDRGLLPCRLYLRSVQQYFQGQASWDAWSYAPTLFWLLDWSDMNFNLDLFALLGLGISAFILVTGCANMILMAVLWVLYLSLVNVGQVWASSRSGEIGAGGTSPAWTSTMRRSPCPTRWPTTCTGRPGGSTASRRLATTSWSCWCPSWCSSGAGRASYTGRCRSCSSGNLSFLNWLTMVPSLACFDDMALGSLFPSGPQGLKDRVLRMQQEGARGARPWPTHGSRVRQLVNLALGALVAWLSVPVVLNLLSSKQVMNTSFSPLRIVNTYGAFGSITKERTEVILQGTASPNASTPDAVWEDYEFRCKPGDPWRRPCLISPYHYRLDWLMWFAAFQTYEHNEWILHLAGKLLANDAEALSLLALNPFEGRAPPRWVRGEHYRYQFSRPGGKHAAQGKWWLRRRIGPYFPPLRLEDLRNYFKAREWPLPQPI
ncbi:lipase maturation factor 1-like isoform X1 [Dipodomys merriami]|uniref:lipase maturation factor 1-like isoform X1 n=1 Tax=Dipodomys merriami TaxID=94247 RepID=UPI003855E79D